LSLPRTDRRVNRAMLPNTPAGPPDREPPVAAQQRDASRNRRHRCAGYSSTRPRVPADLTLQIPLHVVVFIGILRMPPKKTTLPANVMSGSFRRTNGSLGRSPVPGRRRRNSKTLLAATGTRRPAGVLLSRIHSRSSLFRRLASIAVWSGPIGARPSGPELRVPAVTVPTGPVFRTLVVVLDE